MKIVNEHQQSGSLPALPNQIEEKGTPNYLEKNSPRGRSGSGVGKGRRACLNFCSFTFKPQFTHLVT